MRILPALLAVLLLAFAALAGEAASSDGTARALALRLQLPKTAYDYVGSALPEHASAIVRRRFDNTPRSNRLTNAGATLGRVLFHDPLLSANATVSCATCHDQKRAFAERRRTSRGVGGKRGRRNALSLVNLRYHPTNRFFWDERVSSLEEQVLEPIQDPVEMAMSLGKLPARVALRAEYAQLFEAAFGTPEVTTPRIAKALAQFVRSLTSYRSKYDVGLARVTDVQQPFPNFTALENEGKALFFGGRGGGRCASCHVADAGRGAGGRGPRAIAGRLGGETGTGNRPVLFTARRPSNNGLDRKAAVRDRGVAEVSGDDEDAGVFKVPSLRNVELTAPYMHDGRLKTLDAVIRHYDRKVEPHPNLDRRLRGRRGGATPRRLNLSSRDRRALVAFLKTLTDRAFLHDPRFANPFR